MASVTSPSPTFDYYDDYYDDYIFANYTDYTDYTDDHTDYYTVHNLCINHPRCGTLLVINVIIFLLGVVGNGLVIWVIGFKMKQKTVTTRWYLSLAVSDFIFCTTLPFIIHHRATQSWIFGLFMCKFISFVMFLNMFSSVFLMVVISVDRCVGVVFVFWALNNRTMKRATLAVVVAWLFAMALSIPALVVRDVKTDHNQVTYCYNNYEMLPSGNIGVLRFVLGFVFPLVIIIVCSSIIIVRLRNNRMATTTRTARPFKVMTAVIVTFVVCWLPYHIFVLLGFEPSLTIGRGVSGTLASASSCINPFLYAFMGKVGKQKPRSSFKRIVSKIENAFNEEKKIHVTDVHVLSPMSTTQRQTGI